LDYPYAQEVIAAMETRLNHRHALVCGASRGIGRAIAHALADRGARITAIARDESRLTQVVKSLPAAESGAHQALALDLTDGGALSERIRSVAAEGPVHIVVNNSGGPAAGPALEGDPSDYVAAFAQHVLAAQRIAQALVPGMKAAGYGRIVNVISTSVKEPIAGLGVSNTIRGAMASWAKTLAREVGPYAITVNNVLPGFTATERLDYIFETQASKRGESVDAVRRHALSTVPTGRFAAPEEIAAAVAFLASPAAGYVNGINLPVDGGRTGSL
jgi:3-oxoacyl-[acyl-carrier protein] reductase